MALNCNSETNDITSALYTAIVELNLQLPQHDRIRPDLTTPLFGSDEALDSLGLANFIILAEAKLQELLGLRIDLTEDDPFSPATGHFRTVETLVQYIHSTVNGQSRE